MARLSLSLLGPLQIACDSRRISFTYDKVRALLIYLAVEAGHAQSRDVLAELLWPEREAGPARHNLSQALTAMRRSVGPCGPPASFLTVTRDSVQFNLAFDHWLDVGEFTARLRAASRHAHAQPEACAWCAETLEAAVALYRGDFLAQYSVGDSAAYEAWAELRREALRGQALSALETLAAYHGGQQNWDRAVHFARRRAELDPLNEAAHRGLMRLLALSGQRGAALAQYELCRQWLAEELALEPETETTALFNTIRTGGLSGAAHAMRGSQAAPPPAPRHNLPAQTTAFIGREAELAEIAARLAEPACRLLTLVGHGGVGKTRLALQAAAEQVGRFAHGVWFVALDGLAAPERMVSALAEALGLASYGAADPRAQLLDYLRQQQMLLVLDNFEQLLEGAELASAIVQTWPAVKLLVTSRERLNRYGEWAIEVEGLNVPAAAEDAAMENHSAVRLFVESARRAEASFRLGPENRAAVTRICQLVEGMPLGLELAAAWLPVLSCAEIAQEVAHSLDFLTATAKDVPERHRNLRAVFDQSWHLLTEPERALFRRLSVFRGGFSRPAAEAVAGGSLIDLSRLLGKSLLRRTGARRYGMHELLRQYGQARLAERPDEAQAMHQRHCSYWLESLAGQAEALKGDGQVAALAEVASEMENIRAAWAWAVQNGQASLIALSLDALWVFAEVRGLYGEGEEFFRRAADALEQAPAGLVDRALALGKALVCQGSYHIRLGDADQVRRLVRRGLDLLRPLNAQREVAFGLNMLAAAAHMQGEHAAEQRLLQESIALGQASGDRWITAYSLNDLGMATFLLGDAVRAERLCAEGLAIFREIGDQRGTAFTLNNLGVIVQRLGHHAEAERLYRESLDLWRADGHRWGMATTLTRLGVVTGASATLEASAAHFLEAMQIALQVRALPAVLDALVELAAVLACEGQASRAGALLSLSIRHPALTRSGRQRAEWLLNALPAAAAPDHPPADPARALEDQVTELLRAGLPGGV
jgi:predicted ATPase/DNA-binding SARP family transcriptional activator